MKSIKLLSLIGLSMVLSACTTTTKPTGPKLVEISVEDQPAKLNYTVGDFFDPTGLSIKLIYDKGERETLTYDGNENYFTFNPSLDTQLQENDEVVVVEYKRLTCNIEITVEDPEAEVYTVDFSAMDLTGYSDILQSKDNRFKEATMEFINDNANNLLADIDYPDNNEIRFKKDDFPGSFNDPQALVLGSQNYDGYLEMTFTKTIKSVKIKAQQYYNLIKGYGDDPNIYPSYDCQLWDDDLSDYIGDPDAALYVNNGEMHIDAITYEYADDGYTPIPNVPPMCQSTITINDESLLLWANASYRIRVFELQITFAE